MALLRALTHLLILFLTISFFPSVADESLSFKIYSRASDAATPQNNTAFFISAFSQDILLSQTDAEYTHHVEPTIAISENGTIFTGWKNAFSHNGPGMRVSFSKSIDNGRTWSTPFDMPMFGGLTTGQSDPWLVWHNGTLYYAYLEYTYLSRALTQITVAKSTDYGGTWKSGTASYGVGFADKETMTVSNNGTLYVAYDDILSDDDAIDAPTTVRLTRSIDSGESFQERGVIANTSTHSGGHVGPYVTTDSNENIYVAWNWLKSFPWGDVYISTSHDQGASFSQEIDINPESENSTYTATSQGAPKKATLPVIRFDQNDRLYVLWAEVFEPGGTWDIYLRYSDDLGLNWSHRFQINPDIAGSQWQPDMDIDSQGRLHIVWYDEQGSYFQPFYRTVVFSGEARKEIILSEIIEITGIKTSSNFTRPGDYFTIRVDSDDIPHVVWTDGRENEMDIYYSHGLQDESIPSSTPLSSTSWMLFPVIILCLGLFYYRKR
ncbi:MAG: sialidase family protein, partial [Candidatus Hodarchaeota archaeon]